MLRLLTFILGNDNFHIFLIFRATIFIFFLFFLFIGVILPTNNNTKYTSHLNFFVRFRIIVIALTFLSSLLDRENCIRWFLFLFASNFWLIICIILDLKWFTVVYFKTYDLYFWSLMGQTYSKCRSCVCVRLYNNLWFILLLEYFILFLIWLNFYNYLRFTILVFISFIWYGYIKTSSKRFFNI